VKCRALLLTIAIVSLSARAEITRLDHAQSLYLMRCGGCHGIEGASVPEVPTLRDRAGMFLCSDTGREYLVQLPNVALSLIRDDQELADVLNFVAFGLGGASAPKEAQPYTAQEVRRLRNPALEGTTLAQLRKDLVQRYSSGACGPDVSASLAPP
jgi:hypothetical protein